MKWSDGQPATVEDVCFSWGLAIAAIEGRGDHRPRLPRPGRQGRRRHGGRVPGRHDVHRVHDRPVGPDPPDLRPDPAQAHLRQVSTTRQIADAEVRRRRSSAPARTTLVEWKTGQFARFVRNPNYWGKQGFADEIVIAVLQDATDTMVQALKAGRDRLRPRREPRAVQRSSQTEPDITTVAGTANGWTELGFNTLRHRDRQDDQGRRPVDQGAPRPGVPRRPRLRHRQARLLVDRVLGGYGDVGTTIVPPVLDRLARRARRRPHLRHRRWPSRSSTPPATPSTRAASGSTRKASRSASACPARTTTTTTPRTPSSSRTGSASSGSA